MKQKLIASGLTLTLLFGGSTFSSASVKSSAVEEKLVLSSELIIDDTVEPMLWVAVGKAALQGVGLGVAYVLGTKAIGNSEAPALDYEYEEIKVTFDN